MPTISRATRQPPRCPRHADTGGEHSGRLRGPNSPAIARWLVCLLAGLWSSPIFAAVPWHPALPAALKAAAVSERPVLAVFTASWSTASTTLDRTTLASDEAVALITACFEPVCVDVDEAGEMTRKFGIAKVPTAVILSADEQVLTRFEVPETPAEFVAAAARGLKDASVCLAQRRSSGRAEATRAARGFGDVSTDLSGALPTFGGGPSDATTSRDGVRGSVQGTQAVSTVTAKVRWLSSFASETSATAPTDTAIAASFREANTQLPQPSRAAPHVLSREPAVAASGEARGDRSVSGPTSPAPTPAPPHRPDELATAVGLEASVAQSPLPLEPGTAVGGTAPTSPGQSAPWLGAAPPVAGGTAAAPAPTRQPNETATGPVTNPAVATAAPVVPSATAAVQAAPSSATAQANSAGTTASPARESEGDVAASTPSKPEEKTGSSLLAALQKPLTLFAAKPKKAAQDAAPTPAPAEKVAAAALAEQPAAEATAAEDPFGSMPVGMEGYCPVTLAERGAWVEGRAQWGARHRGRTYLFAGAEQQKAFLSDPDRYAPILSGDDPVLALDAGKSTPGHRRYGVTYQSRIYLFSSTETRDAFAANPQRYTGRAVVAEHVTPESAAVLR